MDVFTDVDDTAYRLGVFHLPRPTDTLKCFAVSRQWGQTLTSIYTIILMLIVMVFWTIVVDFVILFWRVPPGDQIPNMGLVGFINSREPIEAMFFSFGYLGRLLFKKSKHPSGLGALFVVLSVIGAGLSLFLGIYVGGLLVVGTSAPARASQVFIPKMGGGDMKQGEVLRLQALRAPAALRAIGSAEAAGVTVRDRVSFDGEKYTSTAGQPGYSFTYSYEVTGYDMGLQYWSALKQTVSGSCRTDYTWFSGYVEADDLDVYKPWGVSNRTWGVIHHGERRTAPRAQAFVFPYDAQYSEQALPKLPSTHRFGILAHSSHRASHRESTSDPWYDTERYEIPENSTLAQEPDPPSFRVRGARPPLSCTQTDVWSYAGREFTNIYYLTDSKLGLTLPNSWGVQLQLDFAQPRIVEVINSAGPSSLISSMTFVRERFDAESSSIEKDMQRLLVATWIASRDTFRNMVMYTTDQNFANAALDSTGKPEEGAAGFAVETPQVATLRFSFLVAAPTVLVGMFLLVVVEKMARMLGARRQVSPGGSEAFIDLDAYRCRKEQYQAEYLFGRMWQLKDPASRKWFDRCSHDGIKRPTNWNCLMLDDTRHVQAAAATEGSVQVQGDSKQPATATTRPSLPSPNSSNSSQ